MKIKTIYLSVFFILFVVGIKAQAPTIQDCIGAKPICQLYYDIPTPYPYQGEGSYLDEIYKYDECITYEEDGIWYTFTAQNTGALRFVIEAHNIEDDFDWIVFDITYGECSHLKTLPEYYMVSSNNWGLLDWNKYTGANSDSSGGFAGNCNGPGTENGPYWNDDILVYKDHVYLLYVSNWSQSTNGYSIDFSASDASIIDNSGPQLMSVETHPCGTNKIRLKFNENVMCNSVSASDFALTGSSDTYSIIDVTSENCQLGSEYSREYTVHVNKNLAPGSYTLSLKDYVSDLCGNVNNVGSSSFTVKKLRKLSSKVTNVKGCKGDATGEIKINSRGEGEAIYYSIDGGILFHDNGGRFTDLPAGDYKVLIKNEYGCQTEIENVTITEPEEMLIDSVLSVDVNTCHGDKKGKIKIYASGGGKTKRYSINGGASYKYSNNEFSNLSAGEYQIKVKDSYGCSLSGETISIKEPDEIELDINQTNIEGCHNDTTGAISIVGKGGLGTLSYSINGGATFQKGNGEFKNLQAEKYRIIVKDSVGCYATPKYVNLTEPDPLIFSKINLSNVSSCHGDSTGYIRISALGGTGNYLFSIDNGQHWHANNGNFNNLPAGEYQIAIKDENNCAIYGSKREIKEPDEFLITDIQKTDVLSCNGNKEGFIEIKTKGGTGTRFYSIDKGESFKISSNKFTELSAGIYHVMVRDIKNCVVDGGEIEITEPKKIKIDRIDYNPTSCYGYKDGSIFLEASGGTGLLSYAIVDYFKFSEQNHFQNLSAGNYTIKIRDENNCYAKDTVVQILQPDEIKIDSIVRKNVSPCFGNKNGEISLFAKGGTGNFTYGMNNLVFQAENTFSELNAGIYSFSVTDQSKCSVQSEEITITQPEKLVVDSVVTQSVTGCFGDSTGTISIFAKGGTAPLQYSIDAGNIFTENQGLFQNLPVGEYKIAVQDFNACLAFADTVHLSQPEKLKISTTKVKWNACFGDADAFILLDAEGGTGNIVYSIDDAKNYSENRGFKNLNPGQYITVAKDENSCEAYGDTITIIDPVDVIIEKIVSKDVLTCNGDSTASIEIVATGGSGNLYYSLENTTPFRKAEPLFEHLWAGKYLGIVKDDNNCVKTTDTITISQPDALVISHYKGVNIDCSGNNNGQISFTTSGGNGDYYFSIDGGKKFQENDSIFTKLTPGKYTIVAKDSSECLFAGETLTISEPSALVIDEIRSKNIEKCFGDASGEIEIMAHGGTGVLSYSIDSAKTMTPNLSKFSNLRAANFYVAVSDENHCLLHGDSVLLSQPSKVKIDSVAFSQITCFGFNNGEIEIFASGGQEKFEYSIEKADSFQQNNTFSSLVPNTYYVVVQDTNHCMASGDTVTITEPEKLQIGKFLKNDVLTCFGDSSGQLSISVSGGTGEKNFSIDNRDFTNTTGEFNNLPAGNYQIYIHDKNLCQLTSEELTIVQPPKLVVDSIRFYDITCNGLSNGKIYVYSSGGTGELVYSNRIDNYFDNEGIFLNLREDDYPIAVKDANNCITKSDTIHITEPQVVRVELENKTDVTCHGDSNGSLEINIIGNPSSVFRTIWSNGETENKITQVSGGSYTVEITDTLTNHCAVGVYSIHEPEVLRTEITSTEAECKWIKDGSITINTTGGTEPYNESIYSSDGTLIFDTEKLLHGEYAVWVTDANLCTYTDSVSVTYASECEMQIELPNVITPNNDGNNESFWFTASSEYIYKFEFRIFNRWGKEIFSYTAIDQDGETGIAPLNKGEQKGWWGQSKFGNRKVSQGVYFYLVRATDHSGNVTEKKGSVHVFYE